MPLPRPLATATACAALLLSGSAMAQGGASPGAGGGTSMPSRLQTAAPDSDSHESLLASLRYCSGMQDRTGRLECYDAIGAYVASRVGARARQEFSWGVQSGSDRGGQPFAVIALDASASGTPADASGSDHGRISLFARCRSGQTSVYVTFDRSVVEDASPMTDVLVAPEGHPAESVPWEVSQDGRSVGLWRNQAAIRSFLDRLLTVSSLRITVAQGKPGQISASFNMSGYPTALVAIRQACR